MFFQMKKFMSRCTALSLKVLCTKGLAARLHIHALWMTRIWDVATTWYGGAQDGGWLWMTRIWDVATTLNFVVAEGACCG